jgi:8-oxo-dGTP diphosphatase
MADVLVPCVGAVVTDATGRVLLARRGHDPGAGLWSLPGGRVEPGETDAEAVAREVVEETGLSVACGRLLGRVRLPGPDGTVADIRDYRAVVTGGKLAAGDDATAVRWVHRSELPGLPVTPRLAEYLDAWSVWENADTT